MKRNKAPRHVPQSLIGNVSSAHDGDEEPTAMTDVQMGKLLEAWVRKAPQKDKRGFCYLCCGAITSKKARASSRQ